MGAGRETREKARGREREKEKARGIKNKGKNIYG
jgi:hypothetical protein